VFLGAAITPNKKGSRNRSGTATEDEYGRSRISSPLSVAEDGRPCPTRLGSWTAPGDREEGGTLRSSDFESDKGEPPNGTSSRTTTI